MKDLYTKLLHIQQNAISLYAEKGLYAEPKIVTDINQCYFYQAVDIPGYGYVPGEWDLREGINEYLGNVNFKGKKVLDVGTAIGYICFYVEKQGAEVIAFDVNEDFLMDYIPFAHYNYVQYALDNKRNIAKMNNSFWYCHRIFNSKAKMVYGTVYAFPEEIGPVDISMFGCILLHLRDPFQALQNVLRLTKETVIITLPHPSTYFPPNYLINYEAPLMIFMPEYHGPEKTDLCTWWAFTPEIIREFISLLGFEHTEITHHFQRFQNQQINLYTIVGYRV